MQPYFSFTASNVGFGFWSHDLVGPYDDHELHTRWLQWGAFSAVFRTHDRGMAVGPCAAILPRPTCAIIQPWDVPEPYRSVNWLAIRRREELVPYIYTAYRQAFDTGISLLRPMYYDYPSEAMAYAGDIKGNFPQYMFGDDILVSPIVVPGDVNTSLARAIVWLPPGTWFDYEMGNLINSAGSVIQNSYDISEVPVYVRAGAIIPGIALHDGELIGVAQRQYTHLVLTVYPGTLSGFTQIYEDNALTTDYLNGLYRWTHVSYTKTPSQMTLVVKATPTTTYPEFPQMRSYSIRLPSTIPPTRVLVNDQPIVYAMYGGVNTWHYDGPTLTTTIDTTQLSTFEDVIINVYANFSYDLRDCKGILQRAEKAKSTLDLTNYTPGSTSLGGGKLSQLSSLAEQLSFWADDVNSFVNILDSVVPAWEQAKAEVAGIQPQYKDTEMYKMWAHANALLAVYN
eukprot:TRINITY_DN5379_c0_g1_i4.p1 TRINITY_DN5379_c0_g1~~TRINITY_DN5379_c0_g1_i4.p1  ORF type:complete len:454 (-),score=92.74 TRINITY_DN5379_c0_g1_i4:141-1502(-)